MHVISYIFKPIIKLLSHFKHSKAVSNILKPFTTHLRDISDIK